MGKLGILTAVWLLAFCPALSSLAWAHPGIHEQQAAAEKAIADDPTDPSNYVIQGKLHHEQRAWDAALDAYQVARERGGAEAEIATLEGDVFLDAGWTLTAKRRYEAALAADPRSAGARVGRARTWMRLDHPEKAELDYAQAFAVVGRVSPALVLERCNALVAMGRPEKAVEVIDEQLALVGLIPSLQEAAIEIEVDNQRYDQALARIDALLDQSPGHPLWAKQRADILMKAGRKDEAQLAYRDALTFVQARNARRGSRRLADLEKEVRAALASNEVSAREKGER